MGTRLISGFAAMPKQISNLMLAFGHPSESITTHIDYEKSIKSSKQIGQSNIH